MFYKVKCLDRYSNDLRIVELQVIVVSKDVDDEIQSRVPSRFLPLLWEAIN